MKNIKKIIIDNKRIKGTTIVFDDGKEAEMNNKAGMYFIEAYIKQNEIRDLDSLVSDSNIEYLAPNSGFFLAKPKTRDEYLGKAFEKFNQNKDIDMSIKGIEIFDDYSKDDGITSLKVEVKEGEKKHNIEVLIDAKETLDVVSYYALNNNVKDYENLVNNGFIKDTSSKNINLKNDLKALEIVNQNKYALPDFNKDLPLGLPDKSKENDDSVDGLLLDGVSHIEYFRGNNELFAKVLYENGNVETVSIKDANNLLEKYKPSNSLDVSFYMETPNGGYRKTVKDEFLNPDLYYYNKDHNKKDVDTIVNNILLDTSISLASIGRIVFYSFRGEEKGENQAVIFLKDGSVINTNVYTATHYLEAYREKIDASFESLLKSGFAVITKGKDLNDNWDKYKDLSNVKDAKELDVEEIDKNLEKQAESLKEEIKEEDKENTSDSHRETENVKADIKDEKEDEKKKTKKRNFFQKIKDKLKEKFASRRKKAFAIKAAIFGTAGFLAIAGIIASVRKHVSNLTSKTRVENNIDDSIYNNNAKAMLNNENNDDTATYDDSYTDTNSDTSEDDITKPKNIVTELKDDGTEVTVTETAPKQITVKYTKHKSVDKKKLSSTKKKENKKKEKDTSKDKKINTNSNANTGSSIVVKPNNNSNANTGSSITVKPNNDKNKDNNSKGNDYENSDAYKKLKDEMNGYGDSDSFVTNHQDYNNTDNNLNTNSNSGSGIDVVTPNDVKNSTTESITLDNDKVDSNGNLNGYYENMRVGSEYKEDLANYIVEEMANTTITDDSTKTYTLK